MLRRVVCGIAALVVVLALAASSAAQTVTISGQVYLPEGEVAPAGGIRVQVLNGLAFSTL